MKPKQKYLILSLTVFMLFAFMPFSYGQDDDFISVSPVEKQDASKAIESGAVEKQAAAPAPAPKAVPAAKAGAKAEAGACRIDKILTLDLKDKVEIRIITSEPVKPKSTELAPPPGPRILVQLPNCDVKGETIAADKGAVSKVRSAAHGSTAWVVIDLKGKTKWDIVQDGTTISVNIPKSGQQASGEQAASEETAAPAARKPGAMMYRIIDVAAKNSDTKTRVIVTTDGPAKYRIKKDSEKKTLTVSVIDAVSIWQKGSLSMETGSVDSVSVKESADKTVDIKLTLNENTPYVVNRDQNQIVIDVDRAQFSAKKANRKLDLYQKISLNVQEASLNAVLRLLSAQSGFEFTTGPSAGRVTSVTIREDNQTLETVLKDILTPQTLYYEVEGNIIRVGDVGELKAAKALKPKISKFYNPRTMKADDLSTMLQTMIGKEPLIDAVIQIDKSQGLARLMIVGIASDVDKIMNMIYTLDAGGSAEADTSSDGGLKTKVFKLQYLTPSVILPTVKALMSTDGTLEADDRSNNLIATDSTRYIKKIEGIIKKLDVKLKQVIIEAKLYEVQVGALKNLGVTWNGNSNISNPHIVGDVSALPIAGTGTLTVGMLQNGINLSATIDILESKNKATLLSSPKIAVGDNQTATIDTSQTTYYSQTQIQEQNNNLPPIISTTYVSVVLPITLIVGAKITEENNVIMSVDISVAKLLGNSTGTAPPDTTTQHAKTQITANNNETVVIGGLITDRVTMEEDKVPFLGDLPLIGNLFKGTSSSKQKSELVVFLTPSLIEE
jgi:type IV pilus assembly protein PilQ